MDKETSFTGLSFYMWTARIVRQSCQWSNSSSWRPGWGWRNCPLSFSLQNARPFSPRKVWHPWRQSGIPGSLYYPFEAYNPQRIWSHFCGISSFTKDHEKHVRYTPTWSNSSFQDLVMDFQRLFYTNLNFERFEGSKVRFSLRTGSPKLPKTPATKKDLGSLFAG